MAKKSGKKTRKTRAAKSAKNQAAKNQAAKAELPPGKTQPKRSKTNDERPAKLPSVWQLTKTSWRIIWTNKLLFFGITIIYGLLSLILVQGVINGTDLNSLKHTLNQSFNGSLGSVASAFSVFTVLVGSTGSSSTQAASSYQLVLGIVTSLAIIWALRQIMTGTTIRIRDAYYRGMYPLVPFILVLIVIGLQLIPLIIGSTIYNLVVANGIAVGLVERLGWLALFLLTLAWSVYMISSSLFALYIVTLPDMTPLKAVRSARGLVKGRRWPIILRLAFLPVILLIIAAVILVPIILVLTVLAKWIFFLMSMFTLVAVHTYVYTLYRDLLNE